MKHIYAFVCALIILSVLITSKLMAAELLWDMPVAGPVTVELGPTPTGPFTTIATIPQGTTRFLLTPGQWGHYRVRNTAGPSNTAQYAMDVYSDTVTNRLAAVESSLAALRLTLQDVSAANMHQDTLLIEAVRRIEALEAPVPPPPTLPVVNITSRQVDQDRIEITGTNCVSLRTTGTGLRRIVECVH